MLLIFSLSCGLCLLQSAAFRMMAVVTHTMDATDVAASQFENHGTLVSTDLSHLAKVDEYTGLCGLSLIPTPNQPQCGLLQVLHAGYWKQSVMGLGTRLLWSNYNHNLICS